MVTKHGDKSEFKTAHYTQLRLEQMADWETQLKLAL